MIIGNLDVVGISVPPHETDPPLVVDADAVLAATIALQSFETVTGGYDQFSQGRGSLQHFQSPSGRAGDVPPAPGRQPVEEALSIPVPKRLDHGVLYSMSWYTVKRYKCL